MPGLSKTKLMSFLQCPKKLWLETHRRDLVPPTPPETQARFDAGHEIGAIAQRLYDPNATGLLIGHEKGMSAALRDTTRALTSLAANPLFEATFERSGLLVRTDILERDAVAGQNRMIEIKSTTSVKDEHVTDCAIQAWVLEETPARPESIALGYIDNEFIYPGNGDYRGLLAEQDITAQVSAGLGKVPGWLRAAQAALAGPEPSVTIGTRCNTPYECPFIGYCWPQTDYPLSTLPSVNKRLDQLIAEGYKDVRDLPESAAGNADAKRVWQAARSGQATLNPAARAELAQQPWPRYYLDFETFSTAAPRWAGTCPYEQIPFQWSLHIETAPGRPSRLGHAEFLELSGEMPARAVATALLDAVGTQGPVFMYTTFERRCLDTLAAHCPELADRLHALSARLVDLHPIAKRNYYHPAMRGSWSIKSLLPTIAPEMDYALLEGVQEGGAAQRAFVEAIDPATSAARKAELREQLLRYCGHDTLAMVRIAQFLADVALTPIQTSL
jgi:hypothetical protein